MHVPTRGRIFGRSDRTRGRLETCLIFEKLVAHRALRVHHFRRVSLVGGKDFAWGVSALFLAPDFSSLSLRFLLDYVELYLCL